MRSTRLLVALLLALALGGCTDDSGSGQPTIVTAVFPFADISRAIVGESLEVIDLTPPGSEAHDVELDTDQLDAVADADVRLVLFVGGGFQPAVETLVERLDDGSDAETVDVARAAPIDDAGDAHVWLDPRVMRWLVGRIAYVATTYASEDSAAILERAAAVEAELVALDEDYEAGLRSCSSRQLVTAHAAFGHLARRYDLETVAVAGTSPEAEPDAARIAEVADLVRERGITTVFTEPGESGDVAATVAREAGVRTAVLDPLEVDRGSSYVEAMRANLAALRSALGCDLTG